MAQGPIIFGVDSRNVDRAMASVARAVEHPAPLMRTIAGIMGDEVEQNFAEEGRPRWMGLARSTIEGRVTSAAYRTKGGILESGRISKSIANRFASHRILQQSGRLVSSIVQQADDHSAAVGTNVVYAAIQHFGGKTKAHKITARNKKALAFGGILVKSVNHPGSKIPARPYLVLTRSGEERIVTAGQGYLVRHLA